MRVILCAFLSLLCDEICLICLLFQLCCSRICTAREIRLSWLLMFVLLPLFLHDARNGRRLRRCLLAFSFKRAGRAGILETFYILYQNIKVVRSDREVFPNVRAPPRLCQNYAQALFRCWESFR